MTQYHSATHVFEVWLQLRPGFDAAMLARENGAYVNPAVQMAHEAWLHAGEALSKAAAAEPFPESAACDCPSCGGIAGRSVVTRCGACAMDFHQAPVTRDPEEVLSAIVATCATLYRGNVANVCSSSPDGTAKLVLHYASVQEGETAFEIITDLIDGGKVIHAPKREGYGLTEFFEDAKLLGTTASQFAQALAKRPEFADCLPAARKIQEDSPGS